MAYFYGLGAAAEPLPCDVTLRGSINDETVDRAMKQIAAFESEVDQIVHLCLDSPNGGKVASARELVGFMEERAAIRQDYGGITTVVKNGMDCRSACALIFMAGFYCQYVDYCRTSRIMEPFGTIGFHSPALNVDLQTTNLETIKNTYYSAIEDLGYFVSLNANSDFVRSPTRYPGSLIREITTHFGDNYYFITTIKDAIALNIDIHGTWQLPDQSDAGIYDALVNACDNYFWMNRVSKGFPFDAGPTASPIPTVLSGEQISYIELSAPLAGGSFIWQSCYIPFYTDLSTVHHLLPNPVLPFTMFENDDRIYASYSRENEIETSPVRYTELSSSGGWELEAIGASSDEPNTFPANTIEALFSPDDYWLFWSMDHAMADIAIRQ